MAAKPMNPQSRLYRELTAAQIGKRERAAAEKPPPKRREPKPRRPGKDHPPVEIIG